MTILVIKQSGVTSNISSDDNILKSGELAYTYAAGDSDGGDRLFIGTGGGDGFASGVHVIGGKYYTDMMDHPKGSVVPSSVIITDANGKIDKIDIDNISIDGNSITTSSGNITLNPNSEVIDASSSRISSIVDPVSAQDAATKNYVDTLNTFDLNADVNVGFGDVHSFETVTIYGGKNANTERRDISNGLQFFVNVDSDLTDLSSLTVDNVKIDGNTISSTSGNLTIDPSPSGTAGTLIVAGNLQVDGTTTTINSTTLEVDDKNITLASGAANAAAADSAGIHVDGAEANIFYRSSDDKWHFNKDIAAPNLNVSGGLSSDTLTGKYLGFDSDINDRSTTDLSEGDNLYYTSARADSAAKNAISTSHSGFGSTSYNNVTGVITTAGASPTEIRSVFSADGDLSYDSNTGQFSIDVEQVYTKANFDSDLNDVLPTTTELAEGTNLYYTDERSQDATAALLQSGNGIDLAYDDSANQLTISTELATSVNPGVARFDAIDFLVTGGNVEIATIDCGLY